MAEDSRVSRAVVVWIGWRREVRPSRDEQAVVEEFGDPDWLDLLVRVRRLEDDFYRSSARLEVPDLHEMGQQAAADFRALHPEISEDAVQALAWCYTYDHK